MGFLEKFVEKFLEKSLEKFLEKSLEKFLENSEREPQRIQRGFLWNF